MFAEIGLSGLALAFCAAIYADDPEALVGITGIEAAIQRCRQRKPQ